MAAPITYNFHPMAKPQSVIIELSSCCPNCIFETSFILPNPIKMDWNGDIISLELTETAANAQGISQFTWV